MTYTLPTIVNVGMEGVDLTQTFTPYVQTTAISATNSPENLGPMFAQGTIVNTSQSGQFIFVKASAAIAQYDFVAIETDFTAAGVSTTNVNATAAPELGVAQVAIASGAYGWVCIKGTGTGNVLLSCAADVALYATTVPGSLDDAAFSSLQPKLNGIVATAARGTTNGSVAVLLTSPFVGV